MLISFESQTKLSYCCCCWWWWWQGWCYCCSWSCCNLCCRSLSFLCCHYCCCCCCYWNLSKRCNIVDVDVFIYSCCCWSRNLSSKFGKNRVSYSWEIADIELAVVVGDGGGVQSHFHVKPNFELSWVGVVTIDVIKC